MLTPSLTSPSNASTTRHSKDVNGFGPETKQALNTLQNAIRRVVASLPESGSRAADLGRALKLDGALAWQIHALAGKPDLLISSRVVPKRGAMERFLRSAERTVAEDLARNVREAYEAFEETVADLAGDRETFDAMLTLQRPTDGAALRKTRRAGYKANAALWGVTCRAKTYTVVFRARPTGEFDSLTLLGYVGLQRLHADAMVSTLASSRIWGENAVPPDDGKPRATVECQLVEEACSKPLPQIEHTIGPDGLPQEFLALDGLGKRSEASIFWRTTALGIPDATPEPPSVASSTCRVPAEMMFIDLLVPRGWLRGEMKTWVTPDPGRQVPADPSTRYRLPFEGAGVHLGQSLSALHLTSVPQYADLVQREIARMGWSDTEFDIFRCEVAYPMLHTRLSLWVE